MTHISRSPINSCWIRRTAIQDNGVRIQAAWKSARAEGGLDQRDGQQSVLSKWQNRRVEEELQKSRGASLLRVLQPAARNQRRKILRGYGKVAFWLIFFSYIIVQSIHLGQEVLPEISGPWRNKAVSILGKVPSGLLLSRPGRINDLSQSNYKTRRPARNTRIQLTST